MTCVCFLHALFINHLCTAHGHNLSTLHFCVWLDRYTLLRQQTQNRSSSTSTGTRTSSFSSSHSDSSVESLTLPSGFVPQFHIAYISILQYLSFICDLRHLRERRQTVSTSSVLRNNQSHLFDTLIAQGLPHEFATQARPSY